MISRNGCGPSFPDICLTIEGKPQPGKLTRPGIEPGPLSERQQCYPLAAAVVGRCRVQVSTQRCDQMLLLYLEYSSVASIKYSLERVSVYENFLKYASWRTVVIIFRHSFADSSEPSKAVVANPRHVTLVYPIYPSLFAFQSEHTLEGAV